MDEESIKQLHKSLLFAVRTARPASKLIALPPGLWYLDRRPTWLVLASTAVCIRHELDACAMPHFKS